MARAKPRRRKAAARKRRVPALPPNDLNAASRAQLGRDPERRPYRPPAEDASVQDPLRDWPEDC